MWGEGVLQHPELSDSGRGSHWEAGSDAQGVWGRTVETELRDKTQPGPGQTRKVRLAMQRDKGWVHPALTDTVLDIIYIW